MVIFAIGLYFLGTSQADVVGARTVRAAEESAGRAAPLGYNPSSGIEADVRTFGDIVVFDASSSREVARLSYPFSVADEAEFRRQFSASDMRISHGFEADFGGSLLAIRLTPVDGLNAFVVRHFRDRVVSRISR